jgi:V-type H+-transporting ATPase subunit A
MVFVCVQAALSLSASRPRPAPTRHVSFCKLIIILRAGILETIFDGIQRPLKTIADISGSVFVPRGVDLPSLDQDRLYTFVPNHDKRPGSIVAGGDKIG